MKKSQKDFKSFGAQGFTLTESLVLVSITTIVIYTIVSSLAYFYRYNAYSIEQSFAITSARRGTENIVQDLREATYSEEGSYLLEEISANEIQFYSDIDRDNSVERLRYFLDNDSIRLTTTQATGSPPIYASDEQTTTVISDNVRNGSLGVDVFSYYDSSGNELVASSSNLADVRFVRLNVVVNVNPARLPRDFTLRSSATLRNLRN